MGHWEREAQRIRERQQQHIAMLQAQCKPGQKLLTCPTCGKICRVPDYQMMVSHIQNGGDFATITQAGTHPGELQWGQ